ncbi:MAG: aminomethyltransferase family protein [Xanthobacteraceae bacterium]|nr:aminomethyltransferase family protein [Xanthobacteraceae bacterium]
MRSTPEGYFNVRFGKPEYTDWMDESMSWKEACYIGDWSFLWERRFKGPDALKLFSDITVNSMAKFDIGQAKHAIHCNKDGKVIHEGILSRIGEDEFMLFGRGGFWADYQRRRGKYNVSSEPDDLFNLQVSGPRSVAVIEKAASQTVRNIGFMRFATVRIAGHEIWALRQGMAGEIGFELQGPIAARDDVYNAIVEAGREFEIRRLGARVSSVNHLEACFPTIVTDYLPAIFDDDMAEYLTEFKIAMPAFASTFNIAGSFDANHVSAWYRSPVELGWTKNIKFDHDFIGRTALESEVANPRRIMRTLVWSNEDVVDVYASLFHKGQHYQFMEIPRDQRGFMYADKVERDGKLIGVTTSRGYSYYFREMISLCCIDVSSSEIGTEVNVIWGEPGKRQKEIRATVAPAPYKSDRRRADLISA